MHGSEVPGEKGGNEAEVTFEEITAKKKKKKKSKIAIRSHAPEGL